MPYYKKNLSENINGFRKTYITDTSIDHFYYANRKPLTLLFQEIQGKHSNGIRFERLDMFTRVLDITGVLPDHRLRLLFGWSKQIVCDESKNGK